LKSELDTAGGGEEDVDFASFDLLEVASGELGFLSELILGPALADSLSANVGAEKLESSPFFPAEWHGTLRRATARNVNDTTYRDLFHEPRRSRRKSLQLFLDVVESVSRLQRSGGRK
jgi:hypothetical protein